MYSDIIPVNSYIHVHVSITIINLEVMEVMLIITLYVIFPCNDNNN